MFKFIFFYYVKVRAINQDFKIWLSYQLIFESWSSFLHADMPKKKTSKQETSLVSLYFLHWTAHLLQRKIKPRKDIFSSMKLLRVLKLRPFSFIQLPHRTTVQNPTTTYNRPGNRATLGLLRTYFYHCRIVRLVPVIPYPPKNKW